MRPLWRAVVRISLSLGALLALAVPALAQGAAAIGGTVLNGTTGGAAPGGLTVTLRISDGEADLAAMETTTDSEGSFRFDGLDTDPALLYRVEVRYLEVSYEGHEGLSFQEGQPELEATVSVYETSGEPSGVRVESVHMIAESFEQVLRVSEVHVLGNSGDRTFTGQPDQVVEGRRVTVFIPLPRGAVGLAFPEGEVPERFVEVQGGIWDTQPVRPGAEASVVRFSYHLTVQGGSVPLEREFEYPVSELSVLVVQPGLALRGGQLSAAEPVEFQGKAYSVYFAQALGPDTPLTIELVPVAGPESTGMPVQSPGSETVSAAASVGQQPLLRWLGFGLVVLAALGAVAYPFLVRPRTRA